MIKGEKLSLEIKTAVQAEIKMQLPECKKISVHNRILDILSKVTPGMMKEAQGKDINISKTLCYVKSGKKPILAQKCKIKSRPVHMYLHKFD